MLRKEFREYRLNAVRCNICPRKCNADRAREVGFCGCGNMAVVAMTMLHMWEEPCISGERGSGAIFFAGCNLRCSYCQNKAVSRGEVGRKVTARQLADIMFDLENRGAHNINLITAGHYREAVTDAIRLYKTSGELPIVYNTSGYEIMTDSFLPLIDIWLPDMKYYEPALSGEYSAAPDYNAVAVAAIDKMVSTGKPVIIRHLILPGHRHDSEKVIRQIAERWGGRVKISLMRQYTPEFAEGSAPRRKVTSFEYNVLARLCENLGLDGYFQSEESAAVAYTPVFDNLRKK